MSFSFPRYNPRLLVDITFPDGGEEGDQGETFVWFANFDMELAFEVRWPISTQIIRMGLGPIGLPIVRRK